MQFVDFSKRKIGLPIQENVKPRDERQDRIDEGMSHRAIYGGLPLLAENPTEAQRLTYAGRKTELLREAKVFDSGKLAASPLFERRLFE